MRLAIERSLRILVVVVGFSCAFASERGVRRDLPAQPHCNDKERTAAAARGCATGDLTYAGDWLSADREGAVCCARLAAENGFIDAYLLLGRSYVALSRDEGARIETALAWYRAGSRYGSDAATFALADLLFALSERVGDPKFSEALGLARTLDEQGSGGGSLLYARMLEASGGLGSRDDVVRAAERAVRRGIPAAKTYLAEQLLKSNAAKDRDKAVQLLEDSAANDQNPWAAIRLGLMYARGEVVARDPIRAQQFLEQGLGDPRYWNIPDEPGAADLDPLFVQGIEVLKQLTSAQE